MRQIHYTISYLKNAWGNNLVKVLTLTLGLSIGLVLFARIAFDLSYEQFLPEAEHIYQVQTVYTTGIGSDNEHVMDYGNTYQPVAPTMPLEIPGVEAGTSILETGDRVIFEGENRYAVRAIYADTMFFQTLTIPILSGSEIIPMPTSSKSTRMRYQPCKPATWTSRRWRRGAMPSNST